MSRLQILVIPIFLFLLVEVAAAGERIDLTSNKETPQFAHVSIQLDAGGHNLVRPLKEDKTATSDQSLPISVAAKLTYDEQRLPLGAADPAVGTPLVVRYYEQAEAVIKVGETGRTPKLTDDRRLIVLERVQQRPLPFCCEGALSREQLDLIDVVGDTYGVDRLLPTQPVALGESWASDAAVMGPLLTLDTVAVCEVQSVLDEFNPSFAKVRLAGDIHGTADGAATQQEVRGVYLFDRKLRRITRLNLAPRLSDEVVAKTTSAARTPLRDLLYESKTLGFRVKHDRQWYVTAEGREAVTFRRVDGGDMVAQCTLTALPPKSAGRQTSLEQFQKDIQFSLGKSFGELVSSRQWQSPAGLYCYEVVARGVVEELPVEWHYYLAAPDCGNRISVAVTIEKPMVERVASADHELVESLQLFPPVTATQTAEQSTGTKVK
jgi:hypothetical protein